MLDRYRPLPILNSQTHRLWNHTLLYTRYLQRLEALRGAGGAALLRDSRIGLEKESLRVDSGGGISHRDHPVALGSALTNPYITTDYSEALLEFITPPFPRAVQVLDFLRAEHQFVYSHLGDELLWATSMPCVLSGEQHVPIARYGDSNAGMMKTVYRRGLGHRYGRVMQVIAGVHFNYSFGAAFWEAWNGLDGQGEGADGDSQERISAGYFALIRNLQRLGWLIPYLFGASPAVCKSFLGGKATKLQEFDASTYYQPYATSLRMGDIGYQNNKENEIGVKACYDSLDEYVDTLRYAIETEYPGYARIGVKVDGEYQQLNANILQIENEYYSTVRPKQLLEGNEKPILALTRRGVAYIELRSLDVNAFHPLGIDADQVRFLEALCLFCLLHDSPRISPWERAEIDKNEMLAAHRGREPGLELYRNGEAITLQAWAGEICVALSGLCALLDEGEQGSPYSDALAVQQAAVADPELTPSARMLAQMRERGESFYSFARRMSVAHEAWYRTLPTDPADEALLQDTAAVSLRRQAAIEADDPVDFDTYLADYFAQG